MPESERSGYELDDSPVVTRPRQRWSRDDVLRCAKDEYPNVLFGILNAISMFDSGQWTITDLWEYFRECGGVRTFTDHAKRWNAEIAMNGDEHAWKLIDSLDYFATRGTAACADRNLPQVRYMLQRIRETVDSINLG